MSFLEKHHSSRIIRSLATAITTATATASQATTNFGKETYQLRICPTISIWGTVGSTVSGSVSASADTDTLFPANTVDYITVSPGMVFAFVSTSTSTGYVSISEMA